MDKYSVKLSQKKPAEIKRELGRAHIIIAILATALIMLLLSGVNQPLSYDIVLATITSALLLLVIIVSLSVSVAVLTGKSSTKK
jgi:predicted ABC-type exoprotein transport system permease subunit